MPTNSTAIIESDGVNTWRLIGGSCALNYAGLITQPQFGNNKSIANTEFVQRALGNYAAQNAFSSSSTLSLTDAGKLCLGNGGMTPITSTLPMANSCPAGTTFHLKNISLARWTIVCQSGNSTDELDNTFGLEYRQGVVLMSDGGINWRVTDKIGFIQTPAQFDNSTSAANTQFVQRALGNFQASGVLQTNYQLLPADAGKTLSWDGVVGLIATLPPLATVPDGATYYLFGAAVGGVIKATVGENIFAGTSGNQNQLTVRAASSIQLTKSGTIWLMSGGSMVAVASGEFAASLATNGWQKLPSGLIIQWGISQPTTTHIRVNYPVQFTSAVLHITEHDQAGILGYPIGKATWQLVPVNAGSFEAYNIGKFVQPAAGEAPLLIPPTSSGCVWLAIGF